MTLKAPEDKPTAKGRLSWLIKQLDKSSGNGLFIKALWPGRAMNTYAALADIRLKGVEILMPETHKGLTPHRFEVVLNKDFGRRFQGAQTFVQDASPLMMEFYAEAGQYLRAWIAPPPKIERSPTLESDSTLEAPAVAIELSVPSTNEEDAPTFAVATAAQNN